MIQSVNPDKLVFNNTIYKRQVFDRSALYPHLSPRERFEMVDECGYPLQINEDKLLFLPDYLETKKRFRKSLFDKVNQDELITARHLIVDDSLPAHLVMNEDEDKFSLLSQLDAGRYWLIKQAGSLECNELFPELREVMLHDLDYHLRETAMYAMSQLSHPKVSQALGEMVGKKNEKMNLRVRAARELYRFPDKKNIPTLRLVYEETAFVLPHESHGSREMTVDRGTWLPNHCLRNLGMIPMLDALEGIKIGFEHPFKEVQHWASIALQDWIERSKQVIDTGLYEGNPSDRLHLIKKLSLTYDCSIQKEFRDIYADF